MLLAFGMFWIETAKYFSSTETFRGYILNDFHGHGFFGCGGAEPMSFYDPGSTGIFTVHRLQKDNPLIKYFDSPPMYIEVRGAVENQDTWLGNDDEYRFHQWDRSLAVYELLEARVTAEIECGAQVPISREIFPDSAFYTP